MGTAIGKSMSGSNVLYAITVEPDEMLAVGRAEPDAVPLLIEDILLFHSAAQNFFVHPSRMASGKDGFCIQDHEPSENESQLGPWRFAAFRGAALNDLKSKTASLLHTIGSPDRLWAAYLRIDDPRVDAAVFSLVEAGGQIFDKPLMLFEATTDFEFGTMEGQPPLRLLFFWKDAVTDD